MVSWQRVALAAFFLPLFAVTADASNPIGRVTVSKSFFNPTIGEKLELTFELRERGDLTVTVLDRDGYPARSLARKSGERGKITLTWDGRDERGDVVPDESWSFKIDLRTKKQTHSYFPAASTDTRMTMIRSDYYDRQSGILAYTLPRSSRVHIQAGTGSGKEGVTTGAVLKTVVNREPRSAGRVLEQWDGRDESKSIVVTDLSDFVMAIATTPLPENAVITTGNRGKSFLDSVSLRKGHSLLTHTGDSAHHAGLSAIEDASPALRVTPRVGKWSERDKQWILKGTAMTVDAEVHGAPASAFLKSKGRVTVYVDGKPVREVESGESPLTIEVDLADLKAGSHILAVNWHSPFGPVAANAFRFTITK